MLTDGVDDAAVSVVSTVQGGQIRNSFLSEIMLRKESFTHEHKIMLGIVDATSDIFLNIGREKEQQQLSSRSNLSEAIEGDGDL